MGREGLRWWGEVEEGVKELASYPNGTMVDYWWRTRCSAPMAAMVVDLGRNELTLRREKGRMEDRGGMVCS
jgi:hypothetical protein